MVRGSSRCPDRAKRPGQSDGEQSNQPSACRYHQWRRFPDRKPACSKVAAIRLLSLDGFEERFEITLAETAAPLALNNLEEKRRPIFDWASENLQHVALVVPIHQDAELLQFLNRLVNDAGAGLQLGVVGMGHTQKLDALLLHAAYGVHDVVGRHRNVLHARTVVELQI